MQHLQANLCRELQKNAFEFKNINFNIFIDTFLILQDPGLWICSATELTCGKVTA